MEPLTILPAVLPTLWAALDIESFASVAILDFVILVVAVSPVVLAIAPFPLAANTKEKLIKLSTRVSVKSIFLLNILNLLEFIELRKALLSLKSMNSNLVS